MEENSPGKAGAAARAAFRAEPLSLLSFLGAQGGWAEPLPICRKQLQGAVRKGKQHSPTDGVLPLLRHQLTHLQRRTHCCVLLRGLWPSTSRGGCQCSEQPAGVGFKSQELYSKVLCQSTLPAAHVLS